MKRNNYILVGSSSELSKKFIEMNDNRIFYTISTKEIATNRNLIVGDYIDDIDKIILFIQEIECPTIVFFNGFLAENRPIKIPDIEEIEKTIKINYFVPLFLTSFISNKINVKKFVYISSFAAIKPRKKNFIYAYSKKLLENSISSMDINKYLFIRFGKINTNFSSGHRSSIFDLEVETAAKSLSKKIDIKSGVIYPNLITKFLSIIFYVLPTWVINKLNL